MVLPTFLSCTGQLQVRPDMSATVQRCQCFKKSTNLSVAVYSQLACIAEDQKRDTTTGISSFILVTSKKHTAVEVDLGWIVFQQQAAVPATSPHALHAACSAIWTDCLQAAQMELHIQSICSISALKRQRAYRSDISL